EDDTNTTLRTDADLADPSPAPETTTETPPSSGTQTDTQAAPSSGDTPLSERDGMLEAVRAVVKTQETPALPPESAATQGQDTDTAGTRPGDTGTPTPDTAPQQPAADPT